MGTKNLFNLTIKHFDFLKEEYGFSFDSDSHHYVREDVKVEIEHISGALNVLFISKGTVESLPEKMSKILEEEFHYPEHFSPWVLSMGDVDSRLAYDAKIIKQYAPEILR